MRGHVVDALGADIDGAAVAHALELSLRRKSARGYFRTISKGLAVCGTCMPLRESSPSSKRMDRPFAARSTISPRSICQVTGAEAHDDRIAAGRDPHGELLALLRCWSATARRSPARCGGSTDHSPVTCSAVFGAGPSAEAFWMNRMPSPGLRRLEDAALDLAELKQRIALRVEQLQEIAVVELPGGDLLHEREVRWRKPDQTRRACRRGCESLRKVIVQVFSRSALENSQVPTMVRGAAGAGGSVTAGSRHGDGRIGRLRDKRRGGGRQQDQSKRAGSGSCRQIITPAFAEARVSRGSATMKACRPPRPGGCRPPAVPSSGA